MPPTRTSRALGDTSSDQVSRNATPSEVSSAGEGMSPDPDLYRGSRRETPGRHYRSRPSRTPYDLVYGRLPGRVTVPLGVTPHVVTTYRTRLGRPGDSTTRWQGTVGPEVVPWRPTSPLVGGRTGRVLRAGSLNSAEYGGRILFRHCPFSLRPSHLSCPPCLPSPTLSVEVSGSTTVVTSSRRWTLTPLLHPSLTTYVVDRRHSPRGPEPPK